MVDVWTFREGVNPEHVIHFLRCVDEIIDAVSDLKDADEDIAGMKLIPSTWRISVQLRKLLLDGNGHLFKNCLVDPNFHPLKRPSPHDQPITFRQKYNRGVVELGFVDGKKAIIEIPEYEQRTTIHPLYGMRHNGDQFFVFGMPFNRDAHPIKFKAWMNTKVLQVDEIVFTAKDLLREVVNREGVHIEIEDSKRFAMPDESSLTLDNVKKERYKAVNAVNFGGMSYAQYFVFCTGVYIAGRSKTLISSIPLDKEDRIVANICRKIDRAPTKFDGRGPMENQTYHMFVLGSDNRLRQESIGDYSILMKIP